MSTIADLDIREVLHGLFDTSPDAILLVSTEGDVLRSNRASEQLFGYPRHELQGSSLDILVPESLKKQYSTNFKKYIAEPDTIRLAAEFNLHARKQDGSEIAVDVIFKPVNTNNQLLILVLVRDITETTRAQEHLKATAAELSRANSELEKFAYLASHDLQEPLRVMANYAQLMVKKYEPSMDEKSREYLNYIVDAARQMQNLIKALLAYSRLTNEVGQPSQIQSELACQKAIKNLKLVIASSKAQVEVGELPSVIADESQLVQVFQNLLGNAIKFCADSPAKVQISAEKTNKEWRFCIQDNGIGIDMKFAERVFSIFQRLNTQAAYEGSGVGLAICRKIIERHGGNIWVKSEPGVGSSFFFTLPEVSEQA